MNRSTDDRQQLLRMEGLLSGLLRYGALVASGWIALGMALAALHEFFPALPNFAMVSDRCLAVGIVLLIVLPVARVAMTTMVFLLEKDYGFAMISGTVLIIITLGFLLGTIHPQISFL